MRVLTLAMLVAICGCADRAVMEPQSARTETGTVRTSEVTDRDNTGINVRDRNDALKTPIDQNENQRDVSITADIRKRVVGSDMSVDAHNVKIITQDGKVTLRGPVRNGGEKSAIEKIAVEVAGAGKVDNQLEIETTPR